MEQPGSHCDTILYQICCVSEVNYKVTTGGWYSILSFKKGEEKI